MRIDAGLDTGDMLLKSETDIGPDEDAIELGARLAVMGADLLVETLAQIHAIIPEKQDPALASYAPILKKEDGLIDWRVAASSVHNRVRGLQPWPGAYTTFRGQTLQIWRSRPAALEDAAEPGAIVRVKPLLVACGAGALELLEVQAQGRKRMSGADFANGQRLSENEKLGEPRL